MEVRTFIHREKPPELTELVEYEGRHLLVFHRINNFSVVPGYVTDEWRQEREGYDAPVTDVEIIEDLSERRKIEEYLEGLQDPYRSISVWSPMIK